MAPRKAPSKTKQAKAVLVSLTLPNGVKDASIASRRGKTSVPSKPPANKAQNLATKRRRDDHEVESNEGDLSRRKKPRAADEHAPGQEEEIQPLRKMRDSIAKRISAINKRPSQMLDIFVFGSGSFGELGLGNKKFEGKKPEDVKRPRLNYNLLADKVSVVQVACGGMYAIALIPESLGKGRHRLGSRGTFKAQLAQSVNKLMKSANMFGSTSMIIILLITMLQLSLVMSTLQFLGQFASKRYHIPLANTGYIQSTYGAVFIMPFISSAVLKPAAPSFLHLNDDKQRDLSFARVSYLVSIVATFILGLSTSLPIFIFGLAILAFGAPGEGFLKSIATLYVTAKQRSQLFTILGLATIASDVWISPALAALFSLGMRLGGVSTGLPYFGPSRVCVLMFLMALFLDLPSSPVIADEESDEEVGEDERSGLE